MHEGIHRMHVAKICNATDASVCSAYCALLGSQHGQYKAVIAVQVMVVKAVIAAQVKVVNVALILEVRS